MPKKLVIDENLAIRIANLYSEPDYSITEGYVCERFGITRRYFRKALDRVIVLGIINTATAKAIAKKANDNHKRKLMELGFNHSSDKITTFYNDLFERRKKYANLLNAKEKLECYFYELKNLERKIEASLFQERSLPSFISSEDERDFIPLTDSEKLKKQLDSFMLYYEENNKKYQKIVNKIEKIEESVS